MQAIIVFQWLFLRPTQRISLYYFRRCTMWFLLHLFFHHDFFTFQKFCASVVDIFLVSNECLLENRWEDRKIMVWSSARRSICLQVDKYIYLSCFSFNFNYLEYLESLPIISWFWNFFSCSYLGAFNFGHPPIFRGSKTVRLKHVRLHRDSWRWNYSGTYKFMKTLKFLGKNSCWIRVL